VILVKTWFTRILIGWIISLFISVIGLYLSWKMDLQSSPVMILFLGIFLVVVVVSKKLSSIQGPGYEKN
jgi:ABC-type Mn2+/Zn2+ transport system permease subunit